jgi:SAM-dependent methyltransferase
VATPLTDALAEIRAALLDPDGLRRAVAAGRRRNENPASVRAELRPVALKRGISLQIVTSDGIRPSTRNVPWDDAPAAVDALLAEPFGNWHVETASSTLQLRVTKKGEALLHRSAAVTAPVSAAHDREKRYLLDPGDALFDEIGGNAAKRRQVDAFLHSVKALDVSTMDGGPLRVVDLGCGNAYLTFAAYAYLARSGVDVEVVGVDVREDQRVRNTAIASRLGIGERVRFVAGSIVDAPVGGADLVLALHACDTATDEALARAVDWKARWILAAPCCHHDIAAQLRGSAAPMPYQMMVRQPILRERFADVLTDSLRATLLRLSGYRVEVVEFVDSQHTPRNLLLRAVRTDAPVDGTLHEEYAALTAAWGVTPALAPMLGY